MTKPNEEQNSSSSVDQVERTLYPSSVEKRLGVVEKHQVRLKRNAVLLVVFTVVCATSYWSVPGISGIGLDSFLGIKFETDSQNFRLIAIFILVYSIIAFGNDYYKGLKAIEDASDAITRTNLLGKETQSNYIACLSDNYLFDAMRRLVKGSSNSSTGNMQSNFSLLERIHGYVQTGVAGSVVIIFMALVIIAEGWVIVGFTEMGTQINAKDGNIELTDSAQYLRALISFVFAILSFLYFSYVALLLHKAKGNSFQTWGIVFAIVFSILQFYFFTTHIAQSKEDLESLHYGCRIGEVVDFDTQGKSLCRNKEAR